MKQLEGMILIETFVSWFLGVISNGIGEKNKRKREMSCLIPGFPIRHRSQLFTQKVWM